MSRPSPRSAARRRARALRWSALVGLGLPLLACSGVKDAFNSGVREEAQRGLAEARGFCTSATASPARTKMLALLDEVQRDLASGKLGPMPASGVVGGIRGACEDGAVEAAEVDIARGLFDAAKG